MKPIINIKKGKILTDLLKGRCNAAPSEIPVRRSAIEQSFLDWQAIPNHVKTTDIIYITTPRYAEKDILPHISGKKNEWADKYKRIINLTEHKKLVFTFDDLVLLKDKPLDEIAEISEILCAKNKWNELMWDGQDFPLICSAPIKKLKQVKSLVMNTDKKGLWKYPGSDLRTLLEMDDSKFREVSALDRVGLCSDEIFQLLKEKKIDTDKLASTIDGLKNRFHDKMIEVSFLPHPKLPDRYILNMFADNGEALTVLYDTNLKIKNNFKQKVDYKVNINLDFSKTLSKSISQYKKKITEVIHVNSLEEEHLLLKKLLTSDIKKKNFIIRFLNKILKKETPKTHRATQYTPDEVLALIDYVSGGGAVRKSRDYSGGAQEVPKVFSLIKSAINKTQLIEDEVLFRGIKASEIQNLKMDFASMTDIKEVVKRGTFCAKGLTSTSSSQDIAFNFGKENGIIFRFFLKKVNIVYQ